MPSRSMSPSTVEVTERSSTPRAAAMFARPDVRQAAIPWSRYSTGAGALSVPTSTAGWSESTTVTFWCSSSCMAP